MARLSWFKSKAQADNAQRSELVNRYVAAMETEHSKDWCRCVWAVHPDDQNIKRGHCRLCNQSPNARDHNVANTDVIATDHTFKGKRMRKVADHPECPVHTREGFLLYFFEWAEKNA